MAKLPRSVKSGSCAQPPGIVINASFPRLRVCRLMTITTAPQTMSPNTIADAHHVVWRIAAHAGPR